MTKSPVRRLPLLLGAGLAVSVALALLIFWTTPSGSNPVVIDNTAVPPVPTLNPEQVARGATLYTQNCASCHGANLEGQPNWKLTLPDGSLPAPPHDASGHTWHHSNETLLDITTRGGQAVYGSADTKSNMPAFGNILSEADIITILDFIKSRWGKDQREYQWWITATRSGS